MFAPSRTRVKSLVKPRDSSSILEALPGKLDTKRHSPSILYVLIRHAFHTNISYMC